MWVITTPRVARGSWRVSCTKLTVHKCSKNCAFPSSLFSILSLGCIAKWLNTEKEPFHKICVNCWLLQTLFSIRAICWQFLYNWGKMFCFIEAQNICFMISQLIFIDFISYYSVHISQLRYSFMPCHSSSLADHL